MFLNLQGQMKIRVAGVNSAENNCAFFIPDEGVNSLQSFCHPQICKGEVEK